MFASISVIGAGTMGNGIAHVFAQHGFQVNLIDLNAAQLERAATTIAKNFDRQVGKGILTEEQKQQAMSAINYVETLEAGVTISDLVIEAASENLDTKLSIFRAIDKLAPVRAILASNTSSISITRLAAVTSRPQQVIGMHFMNPVPVMKLVEIISGFATSAETTKKIVELAQQIGKTPAIVNDYPGFVANRILMPMINEAIYTVQQGVAGVEAIDQIMKLGMAHPMGPLQLADFIGLDICHSILQVLFDGFKEAKYAPCPLLTNMVNAGFLGVKTGEGFYRYEKGQDKIVSQRFHSF